MKKFEELSEYSKKGAVTLAKGFTYGVVFACKKRGIDKKTAIEIADEAMVFAAQEVKKMREQDEKFIQRTS